MLWIIAAIVIPIAIFVALILLRGFYTVPQSQAKILERLGRFRRVAYGGLNVRIPFLDTFHYVEHINRPEHRKECGPYCIDLREQIFDVNKQQVISKDNVHLEVDTIIYYKVIQPEKAAYGITDLPKAIEQLALTNIRNEFGRMDLDEALGSRTQINLELKDILEEAASQWGVTILRVEVQEIIPPADLKDTMQKQMIAERERRAKVLYAQAEKEAMILMAEGAKEQAVLEAEAQKMREVLKAEAEKQRLLLESEAKRDQLIMLAEGKRQANLLESEGEKIARINLAEAEAAGIRKELNSQAEGYAQISEALSSQQSHDALITLKSLEAAVQIAEKLGSGQATKIFLPQEMSGLMSMLLSVTEMLNRLPQG